jgi:hypothetical protein
MNVTANVITQMVSWTLYDIFELADHPFTERELNNVVSNLNYI